MIFRLPQRQQLRRRAGQIRLRKSAGLQPWPRFIFTSGWHSWRGWWPSFLPWSTGDISEIAANGLPELIPLLSAPDTRRLCIAWPLFRSCVLLISGRACRFACCCNGIRSVEFRQFLAAGRRTWHAVASGHPPPRLWASAPSARHLVQRCWRGCFWAQAFRCGACNQHSSIFLRRMEICHEVCTVTAMIRLIAPLQEHDAGAILARDHTPSRA